MQNYETIIMPLLCLRKRESHIFIKKKWENNTIIANSRSESHYLTQKKRFNLIHLCIAKDPFLDLPRQKMDSSGHEYFLKIY